LICVLQFDAASVAVVGRMLGEGRLPALAGLRARGRHLELATPADHFAAGAFHTLYSGVELGDHGLFYPFQWDASAQRARYMTAFDAPPAIWERLARAGRRTLAIDPYESRPPRDWRGTYVCGWQFADRVVLPRWSLPGTAGAELAERHGGRGANATEIFGRPRVGDLLALRETLVAAPGRVADAAVDLLGRERYDLAWLTFSAAHLAGHQFWDCSQLGAQPAGREREQLQSALAAVYEAVDAAFARVLEALPDDADVIVTSAVGMDVNSSRADLLPGMLAAVLAGGPIASGDSGSGAIWRLRGAIPTGARAAIARALPDRLALELTARLELRGMDWSQTLAFAHPADNQGYLRLNLRGRERDGIVDPREADELLDRIASGLRTFCDPDGTPAVAGVERVAAHHPGERCEQLPDLVVRWSERPATTLAGVRSPAFGEIRRSGAGSGRSGNHTPGDAWAVVAAGTSTPRSSARPRLADVASTVAAVCGVDAEGLSGESLLDR